MGRDAFDCAINRGVMWGGGFADAADKRNRGKVLLTEAYMVEVITSVGLPVDEKLMIKKNRIGSGQKRISIVTGIHGDELEGQYVC